MSFFRFEGLWAVRHHDHAPPRGAQAAVVNVQVRVRRAGARLEVVAVEASANSSAHRPRMRLGDGSRVSLALCPARHPLTARVNKVPALPIPRPLRGHLRASWQTTDEGQPTENSGSAMALSFAIRCVVTQ